MLTPWRVRLLGDFRVERGHQVVTRFRSRATMALFAYLCLQPGRLFSREELADRFWPDVDVEAGRASLRVALNSLKKALEPPPDAPNSVIEATREAIRLRPEAVIVDVREFEKAIKERRIEDALALYGGDFLPGFYDEWVIDEQGRLQGLLPELPPPPPCISAFGGTGVPGSVPSGSPVPAEPEKDGGGGGSSGKSPCNLPLTLDAYFGREAELTQAQELLQTNRLVCLRGPGGMGKTRTALEVARAASGFPGGVWFVPLADVLDSRRIPGAISEAMGLPSSSEPLAGVTERTLVVLDNLEQLGSGVGAEIERLLARVPALVVLATSRTRVGVRGERVITLGALPLPEAGEALGTLAQKPAVALFCDRARGASAEFGLTERNAGAVTVLCAKLEGLPLAIELVAAWAGALTPAQMLERFEKQLAIEARKPDREARHLSLRAAIGWSVDLLTPELRRLFYALSVFRGGFTAEVAGEVAAFDGIHDGLTRLREQSLLTADLSGEVARFSLPEAIREFAEEQLTEEVRERHAAWAYREGDAVRLGIEEDANVRAALAFFQERGRIGDFMRLTGRYAFTWFRAGHLQEGQEALEVALARDSDTLAYTDRLAVYRIRGAFFHFRQDAAGARAAAEACIALAEANDDPVTVATMMMDSATTLLVARQFTEALAKLQEVLPRVQALGRIEDHSACLNNLGICAIELGQWESAADWLAQAVEVSQNDAARFRYGLALDLQARLARCQGNLPEAIALLEQAEAAMRADNHEFYLVFVLQNHAVAQALLGDFAGAYSRLAECLPIQKTTGSDEGWLDIAEALLFVKALEGTLSLYEVSLLGACEALRQERNLLPRLRLEAQNWQELMAHGSVLWGNVDFHTAFDAGQKLTLPALVDALDKVVEIR